MMSTSKFHWELTDVMWEKETIYIENGNFYNLQYRPGPKREKGALTLRTFHGINSFWRTALVVKGKVISRISWEFLELIEKRGRECAPTNILQPLPSKDRAAIGCTEHGQPIRMTVHSDLRSDELISYMICRGWIAVNLEKNSIFIEHPVFTNNSLYCIEEWSQGKLKF